MRKLLLIVFLPIFLYAQTSDLTILDKRRGSFPNNFLNLIAPPNLTLQAFWDATYPESIVKDGNGAVSLWMDRKDGLRLGNDLLSGWDFQSGWGAGAAATVNSPNTFSTTASVNGYIFKSSFLTKDETYECRIAGTISSAELRIRDGGLTTTYSSYTGTFNDVFKFVAKDAYFLIQTYTGAATVQITSLSLRKISTVSLSQSTTSARPYSNGTTILFDGTSDFLKTAQLSTWTQPITVIFVGRQVSWTSGDALFDGYSALTGALYQRTASPNLAANAGNIVENSLSTINYIQIYITVFNGVSSSFWVNSNTITGNFGAYNMGGFTLGARGDNTNFSNIEVFAIVVLTGTPTDWQLTQIREYFYQKFGYLITR